MSQHRTASSSAQTASSSASGAIQNQINKAMDFCETGNGLYEAGDYKGAINAYNDSIASFPTYFQAHQQKGNAFAALEGHNIAITCYEEALKIQMHPTTHIKMGDSFAALGQYLQAIECYNKAIEINNIYALPHAKVGAAWAAQLNHTEALIHYETALKFCLSDKSKMGDETYAKRVAETHTKQGISHTALGQYKNAEDCYTKALALYKNAETYTNWGIACAAQEQYSWALDFYEKALHIDSNYSQAHRNQSDALSKLGFITRAEYEMQRAIELEQHAANALYIKGNTLRKDFEDNAGAIACYTKAISLNQHTGAYIEKGKAYHGLKQYEKALACYNEALQFYPNSARLLLHKGHALMCLQHYDEALVCYNKAIPLTPYNAMLYLGKARALIHCDYSNEDVLEALNYAIRFDSTCAVAYILKGDTLMSLGKEAEAEEAYEEGIELVEPAQALKWAQRRDAAHKSLLEKRAIPEPQKNDVSATKMNAPFHISDDDAVEAEMLGVVKGPSSSYAEFTGQVEPLGLGSYATSTDSD